MKRLIREFAIFNAALASDKLKDPQLRINPSCTDLELGEQCSDDCITQMFNCINNCGPDTSCQSACARDQVDCVDSCPCFGECYDGCDECDHPICGGTNSCKNLELYLDYQVCKSIESEILGDCVTACEDDIYCILTCDEEFIEGMMECPCQANCPDGCPCPNYICQNDDRFTLTEVLLIYQRPSENVPYPPNLINAPLSQVTEINFTWPRNINLYSSCIANLNGEPHIFGGYPDAAHRSQKFVVRDCAVKKELDVPFDASLMACNSYKHEDKELVVLCFSPSESKAVTCHTYDGMVYGKIDPALHDHKNSRLAHYFGNPFVVGGTENTKTEVYDFDYETWVELPPFPFATFIHSYGATTVGNTVYIVGGTDTFFENGNKIYSFDHIWAITPGNLQRGRHGHSAIYHNGLILIVGGPGDMPTETWKVNDKQTKLLGNSYKSYSFWPLLSLVPEEFCVSNAQENDEN